MSAGEGARRAAMLAMEEALRAADPRRFVERAVRLREGTLVAGGRSFRLDRYRRVLVIGAGKASCLMAEGVWRILGERVTEGLVIIPEYQREVPELGRIRFERSTHPLPTLKGVRAVRRMLEVVGRPGEDDMVLCLISGGGSSLMPMPAEGVKLRDKAATTEMLMKAGADIRELNCVRKHLSAIKGGRLAERLFPATVLTLVVSDVVGDDIGFVASGPTVPDATTYRMARSVLVRRSLWGSVPESVRRRIQEGVEGRVPETPKPGSGVFSRVHNVLIGTNRDACIAAVRRLRVEGYRARLLSTRIQGEAREVGRRLGLLARRAVGARVAFVAGGETTVRVVGKGRGGRNQELALAAAMRMEGARGAALLAFSTDGVDGPTDAAGAIADWRTVERASAIGMDPARYLEENDSYDFFRRLGDLVMTGPTGANVNDVVIALVSRRKSPEQVGRYKEQTIGLYAG